MRHRVLIVEDDHIARKGLADLLALWGYEVASAADGAEALERAAEDPPEVVVSDLVMPGMDGLALLSVLRTDHPEAAVIMLTGQGSIESAVQAMKEGAYDYLTKPLESLAAYELSLTRALEHRHLLRENARLFQEVQRLAITDPLTGLYNRHRLADALETEGERAVRYGRPVSMIMMDVDDLKVVNDSHGHPAGDVVLQRVADAIRGNIRRLDLPTRYGGDEFLVLLPETTLADAERVAERIGFEVRRIRAGDLTVTACCGVVEWSPGFRSGQEFLSAVDRALYEAKRRGHGAIVVQAGVPGAAA